MKRIQAIVMVIMCMLALTNLPAQNEMMRQRGKMVEEQLASRGIHHAAILDVMRRVPRHLFIPKKYRYRAYFNSPVPIGYGQTISQPYIVAFMTEAIDPKQEFKVLDIGTGSGYQAAILSELVDSVFSIEIIPDLGRRSARLLDSLGYTNVECKIGDGFHGWKEHAPFDAIIVAAAPNFIPTPLIEQLKEGGKMVIPVGPAYQAQKLMVLEKKDDKIKSRILLPVRFVPFQRNKAAE